MDERDTAPGDAPPTSRQAGSNRESRADNAGLVAPGKAVEVTFTLRDEEGCLVQTDQDSFDVVIGARRLLPQIESGLLGLQVGEQRTIRLKPNEAFGRRDADKVIDFDRDEFPSDVKQGDHFEAEDENGGVLVLRILDVQADHVKVDLNHPLAGQTIEFDFLVTNIRQPTERELEAATMAEKSHASAEPNALLPVGSLLRGRNRR